MSICTITGTVRSISGEALPGATLKFERATLTGQDGSVVTRGVVRVTADDAGQVSVDLYTGVYRLTVIPAGQGELSGQRGITTVTVPEAASADLSELMEQTPALTPSLVAQALSARDQVMALYDAWMAAGGTAGADGKSAYEVAVAAGFVGSEVDWLASLVGPQGASAYQVAVAAGFTGTEAEWLASLVGADGQSVTVMARTDDANYEAAVTANASNPLVLVIRYA